MSIHNKVHDVHPALQSNNLQERTKAKGFNAAYEVYAVYEYIILIQNFFRKLTSPSGMEKKEKTLVEAHFWNTHKPTKTEVMPDYMLLWSVFGSVLKHAWLGRQYRYLMLRGDTLPSMHSSFPLINLAQIREKQGNAKPERKGIFLPIYRAIGCACRMMGCQTANSFLDAKN